MLNLLMDAAKQLFEGENVTKMVKQLSWDFVTQMRLRVSTVSFSIFQVFPTTA